MKDIIVIGDIHGLRTWEQIVEKHPDNQFVFLGDYNDPYDPSVRDEDVLDNFRRLIEFKLAHTDKVTLLLGNHDMHYLDTELATLGTRFNVNLAFDLMMLFDEYSHCFQYAYQFENLLFTHAGVSEEWFMNVFRATDRENVASLLNHSEGSRKEALHHCGVRRGGKHPYGGIFWADKDEFDFPLEGYVQVVGHNRIPKIEVREGMNEAKIIFCDSLHKGNYLKIDLSSMGHEWHFDVWNETLRRF